MVAETITNCSGNKQDQLLQIRAKIYKPRIRKSNTTFAKQKQIVNDFNAVNDSSNSCKDLQTEN